LTATAGGKEIDPDEISDYEMWSDLFIFNEIKEKD